MPGKGGKTRFARGKTRKTYRKRSKVSKIKKDVKKLKMAMGSQVAVLNRENDPQALTANLATYVHRLGGDGAGAENQRQFFQTAVGDTDGSRSGNKCLGLNFDLKGCLECTQPGSTYVRIILTQAKDGVGPNANDILRYYEEDANHPMKVILSPYTRKPTSKFSVIYDRVHKLELDILNDNANITKMKTFRILQKFSKGGVPLTYSSSSNVPPNNNFIQLWAVYGNTANRSAAGNVPTISWLCRERFVR